MNLEMDAEYDYPDDCEMEDVEIDHVEIDDVEMEGVMPQSSSETTPDTTPESSSTMASEISHALSNLKLKPTLHPESIISSIRLYQTIQDAFPMDVSDFESKWAAARAVCAFPYTPLDGDPEHKSCFRTDEFRAIFMLGPKIMPFIIYKLATSNPDEQCFWVLHLGRYLRSWHKLPIGNDVEPWDYAFYLIEGYYASTKRIEECFEDWTESNKDKILPEKWQFQGRREYQTLCRCYAPSVTAYIMLSYFDNLDKGYPQHLHRTFNGGEMVPFMVKKTKLFLDWCRWLNEGEDDQPPEGTAEFEGLWALVIDMVI